MKNFILLLLPAIGTALSAQSIDYNTDDGYAAEGYDVVAYFSNTPKEGSSKHVARYAGVKYKFSSRANMDLFLAKPKKYIPQYGGYCAYAMGTSGEKVSIDPETFEIRNGKLFLFYNSWGINTFKSWKKESPDKLKLQADKNWELIKYKH